MPSISPTVSPPALSVRERCSVTPPATSWQIPSSCRCLVCGRLGCEACSVKVDPEATRQRLDNLRLNTPYERAKLARCGDDLISEESRQRQRLVSRREAWVEGLHTAELMDRHLVRVVLQEALYRREICASEESMRHSSLCAADQHAVLLALQSSESAARQATLAREKECFAELLWRCGHAAQLVQLQQREATTREALSYNEASQWHRLQASAVERRSRLAENVRTRLRFCDSFAESREGVCREWLAGLESLAAAAAAHRERLAQHVQQRCVLWRLAEQSKRDVAAEEAATRLRVREEMAEEADYLVECHRIFARQRATLCRAEASQRQGICEETERGYHALFADMKADEEDAHAAEAEKAERRQSALLFALDALCTIQHEEHTAFTALLQRQADDVAGRQAWMEAKAAARAALWEICVHEKTGVMAAAEAEERAVLRAALVSGVADIAQQAAARRAALEELCDTALGAVAAVVQEELRERDSLYAHMAAREAGVRQWCVTKRAALLALADGEEAQRSSILQQETVCRQAVYSSRTQLQQALEERAEQHRQERAKALSTSLDGLLAVAQEERLAWEQLCQRASEHHARAIDVSQFRCQLEILHAETQHRALLAQDEVAARTEVQTKMSLAAHYAAEAALAALRVQLSAVATAEAGAREIFYEHVGAWYDAVAAQQREEELRIIVQLEQRIRDELRARQACMTEDPRLYTEEDPLPTPTAGSGDASALTWGFGAAGAGGRGEDQANGGMHDVRKALVLETLGNPPCAAALSVSAVDFLVAVIDRAGRRRGAAQEALAVSERMARDAAKKVAQYERQLAAEREKKEMYDVSSQREAEERERRMHGEAMDKARSQQSIAAEKRRLTEAQAELQEHQRALEALKGSINKQYNR